MLIDHSQPAPGALPDPTAQFNQQADEIAAQLLAGLGQASQQPQTPAAPADLQPPTPPPVNQPASPDLAKLLAKVADLEEQLSRRSQTQQPQSPAPSLPSGQPSGLDPRALQLDAVGALQAAGIDVGVVTRQLVAAAMGSEAPPHLQDTARVGGQVAALAQQVQQLQAQLQESRHEGRLAGMQYDLYRTASSVDTEKFPAAAAMAKANPQWVETALREMVVADARQNRQNPDAQPLSAAEAMSRLEGRLKPLFTVFSSAAQTSTAAPAPAPQSAPAPATPSALSGVPSTGRPQGELSWEQKTQSVMDEVLRKFGIQ